MEFSIEDTTFDPADQLPRSVAKAIKIIAELPDGKLLLGQALAQRIGIRYSTLDKHCNHPAIKKLKVKQVYDGTIKNLYGNAATIAAYKEQAGQ